MGAQKGTSNRSSRLCRCLYSPCVFLSHVTSFPLYTRLHQLKDERAVTSLNSCQDTRHYWRSSCCSCYHWFLMAWASCQIRKIAGCACAGNAGNVFPPPRVSDPDMHHGTCATHVPWCMPGSLTSGFLWSRWRGKRSRHSRCMRNPQFYVSGKRPMEKGWILVINGQYHFPSGWYWVVSYRIHHRISWWICWRQYYNDRIGKRYQGLQNKTMDGFNTQTPFRQHCEIMSLPSVHIEVSFVCRAVPTNAQNLCDEPSWIWYWSRQRENSWWHEAFQIELCLHKIVS